LEILSKVRTLLAGKNARTINIDATVVAEAPKLQPYIEEMRAKIAKVITCEVDRINIKATTNEGLGALGRGEGMIALATAMVEDV
ncbi:MAG: 2-C-methyl-D-erythritol 2,4-cyclodiphosphate synthase, partial [Verrucomicrobiota bacterium]|nr:2-C-methyl-D-erythritol 2,4-cyclodiphosphate synthase [Verrucomicrobiota bacterium]